VLELGIYYPTLLEQFKKLKKFFGEKIRGFSEMDVHEIVNLTGLTGGISGRLGATAGVH
jgi:hypothetical protein